MNPKEIILAQTKDVSYTDKLHLKIKTFFLHMILKLESF